MEELSLNTRDEGSVEEDEDDQDEQAVKLKASSLELATCRKKDKSQWSLF
jgi:hypothetical protein